MFLLAAQQNFNKMCSQDSERAFQIEKENDNGWQGNAFLDELYQKYGSIDNGEDLLAVDDILAMFDDNGERISNSEEKEMMLEELLDLLDEEYGHENPAVNYVSVEELLDKFDDNGFLRENNGKVVES